MTTRFSSTARRALISVSDKTGIVAFARRLQDAGVRILSTGGSARFLSEHGVAVTEVADYTGFPEIMAGRVKTLHPKIHAGILGRRDTDDSVMARMDIEPIDLVVVNLYPFERTTACADCDLAQAIESIDVGGPALLRAAAKNHGFVTVIVDPADYEEVAGEWSARAGRIGAAHRFELAIKAFEHTARYDRVIADYLASRSSQRGDSLFPPKLMLSFDKAQDMRYGENPHQRAAFYRDTDPPAGSITAARQLQGKPLSFNNIADADAALACVKQFDRPACVIVKHANPCGAALADEICAAYRLAYRTDPTSAFGGIIAFNRELDERCAREIIARQFVEVIVAPQVSEAAKRVLAAKGNVRVLACGRWRSAKENFDFRRVDGGILVQESDSTKIDAADLSLVSKRAPTDHELDDMLFAWRIAKFVKSNAIVYASQTRSLGIGAGQMSRVYAVRIAAMKAADEGLNLNGAVMASDAFFPFRDSIVLGHELGITAVIQPGGSQRDEDVIAAADEHGMAMVFTGIRHFRH